VKVHITVAATNITGRLNQIAPRRDLCFQYRNTIQQREFKMNRLTKLALMGAAIATLPTAAWALGTLGISSATKITTATGNSLIVTSTCVKDAGKVRIWVSETSSLAQTKIFTARKECGKTAATTGTTVSVPVNSLAPGTYQVILKQDGVQSAPSAPIKLP
jgi:uncharacterized protein (DUF2141 family)